MRITILGSGSRGNSALVEAGGARILVDAGLSPKEVERRMLSALGEPLGRLDGIVLTHAHGDHVGHTEACAAAFDAPVYLSEATRRCAKLGSVSNARVFGSRTPFSIGSIEVRPHPIPHDAPQVALVFSARDICAALVTDLGEVDPDLIARLTGVSTLFIESNYEPALLAAGPYPPKLQRRIASGVGHLSNAQTAAALEILASGLDDVILMHVSETNNEPRLARAAAEGALGKSGAKVRVASQNEPLTVELSPRRGQLSLGIATSP